MPALSPLLERSFDTAIAAVEQAADLSADKKRHWVCSLRQISRWLDRPLETVPARWTSIRIAVDKLHHARLGVTAKTVANHKSNVAAALRWFGKEHDVSPRGIPLSAAWAPLRDAIEDVGRRARLYGLMRYCSGRGIEPTAVNDRAVAAYLQYRTETSSLAGDAAAFRSIARTWNQCAAACRNWPKQRLTEPPIKTKIVPAWEDFPQGLRADIDSYLADLGKVRKVGRKRHRPCTARTIRTRRAELAAVARMAVREGTPIETLTTLAALLDPDVVEKVVNAYWTRNGKEPKVFTIELGSKLLGIARHIGMDEASIERLDDIRYTLETHRNVGLTDKNLTLIRQVLSPGVWTDVVSLPMALMQQARADQAHAPVKAAVTAQIAIAIAILSFMPVRLANLVAIELDQNLSKPAGPDSSYWLTFPHYDVKNRVNLNFQLGQALSDLIDEYVHEFRPTLLRGTNTSCLFPGETGAPKTASMFSTQITERVLKETGLRVTAHQFRHACAAIYLKHHPGEYEVVRQLLGHRNIQTTIRFYCSLESTHASEKFGNIIRNQIDFDAAV